MIRTLTQTLSAVALLGLAVAGHQPALAQEKKAPSNAVGASSAWKSSLNNASSVDGSTFDDRQLAIVEKVNGYFNGIKHLRGRFAQTDAQNRTLKR